MYNEQYSSGSDSFSSVVQRCLIVLARTYDAWNVDVRCGMVGDRPCSAFSCGWVGTYRRSRLHAHNGRTQELRGISVDCDSDAVKFTVWQHGAPPAFCHFNRSGSVLGWNGVRMVILSLDVHRVPM